LGEEEEEEEQRWGLLLLLLLMLVASTCCAPSVGAGVRKCRVAGKGRSCAAID
jgi:hypothetical protein